MDNQSFDWLLHGCHVLSEVAVAYFPNYQYNCSAVKAFRRIIKEHAVLLNQLTEAGFTPPALKCVLVDATFHSTIIDMR